MIFNEIKCHVNTSLGLVGGMHPLSEWETIKRKPMKRDAVWFSSFNSLKIDKCQVVSYLNLYAENSNQKAVQFWGVVNSLKTWKNSNGVFWYSSESPGICPVCPMADPALTTPLTQERKKPFSVENKDSSISRKTLFGVETMVNTIIFTILITVRTSWQRWRTGRRPWPSKAGVVQRVKLRNKKNTFE